ncbi:response regulator [Desulfovibrio psychrotolerans]|uniref:Two-component system response regulator n=1 Tax=Desulfovibrio psychrotolerans TaxID=415242 RepID=A0A7J0BTY7_9BACT|nr:response regulator [Desulfovibrio psychrotolerans]GFM36632.1 two-component system response regulator [Desulfovibrio psychrotolerans]
MKLRVLFVDDEPNVLNGLRLVLRSLREKWSMAFAGGAVEALEILAREPYDVVVTDMRMPGMDGGDLLSEVQRLYPDTLRIILSGYSDHKMIMKTVKPAHQFLTKPCNHKELEEVVERSMRLRTVLGNERVRAVFSDVDTLPSLPDVYASLEAELGKEDPSLHHIGNIIESDMGLTASLLKLVNSSFFGLRRHVSSPHQAVVLLGTDTVKSLMLVIELVKRFVVKKSLRFNAGLLWQHCTQTGHLARCLAVHADADKEVMDHAFIAGLMHDVGKLVLLTRLADDYAGVLELVRSRDYSVHDAEREVFCATHAEMGAYLLALWGMPAPVVEAVLGHHEPVQVPHEGFAPVTAVHVANVMEHELVIINPQYRKPAVDAAYIDSLGLTSRMQSMRMSCLALLEAAGKDPAS